LQLLIIQIYHTTSAALRDTFSPIAERKSAMSKMENIAKVTSLIPLKAKEERIKAVVKAKVKTKERKVDIDTLKITIGGRMPTQPPTRDPIVDITTTPTTKDNDIILTVTG
jgi:hypothetical protein